MKCSNLRTESCWSRLFPCYHDECGSILSLRSLSLTFSLKREMSPLFHLGPWFATGRTLRGFRDAADRNTILNWTHAIESINGTVCTSIPPPPHPRFQHAHQLSLIHHILPQSRVSVVPHSWVSVLVCKASGGENMCIALRSNQVGDIMCEAVCSKDLDLKSKMLT